MTNPYTHLLTLLDDESNHSNFNWLMAMVMENKNYDVTNLNMPPTAGFIGISYTTSLDEMIPLWPKGYYVEMSFDFSEGHFICHAYECKPNDYAVGLCRGGYDDDDPRGKKPTPALAMLECLLQVLEHEWEGKNV